MSQAQVYEWFRLYFPKLAEHVGQWFHTKNPHSVRIRLTNGEEYVFTCNSKTEWCLETIDAYHKRIKGGK